MSRPDPIQYAERLYGAIRAANFSPISFLAFGNAVKEGVSLRSMPRIAAEPFMRIVGEMLDLEQEIAEEDEDIIDAETIDEDEEEAAAAGRPIIVARPVVKHAVAKAPATVAPASKPAVAMAPSTESAPAPGTEPPAAELP